MKSELIVDHNPKSPISEAIKNIRTNLRLNRKIALYLPAKYKII